MSENTRFEEYERKTRKIIFTIGIIAFCFFLFGLLVISSDTEVYNPEEDAPDFVENQNILPEIGADTGPIFIDTEATTGEGKSKPIKVTPAQINMNKFVLGVDVQNQSVLTIGTDGSESIHIERVELVEETEDGFDFRDKLDEGIVILVSQFEGKCSYFVGVTKDYVAKGFKAGDIVKKINAVVDGRGGGKPDFAQGGCPVNDKIAMIKTELKNFF